MQWVGGCWVVPYSDGKTYYVSPSDSTWEFGTMDKSPIESDELNLLIIEVAPVPLPKMSNNATLALKAVYQNGYAQIQWGLI